MSNYDVMIERLLKKRKDGETKSEIWEKIVEGETGKITNKLIWWEDDEGIFHDGTKEISPKLKEAIDNAWLEKKENGKRIYI